MAYREYLERIAAIPGVEAAATVTGPPLRPSQYGFFHVTGEPDPSTQQPSFLHKISPDYFRALRIPLLAGRTFRDDDRVGRPMVAIVNQEFVRRYGIGSNPVGRQIEMGGPFTIVGVVGDVRMRGLDTAPDPQVYMSHLQAYDNNIYIVVRSSTPPGQLASQVKAAIRSSYADQPVFHVSTMEQVLSKSVAEPRFQAFLIGAFALLALAMAASGMYSVISCLVSQRTGEIAIRIALGAGRGAIVKTVLGATSAWVVAGLAGGLGLGLAASSTVRKLSHTAAAGSPAMYAGAAVFFLAVTLAAAYMPVRRASRLDPAVALRCE